MVCKPILVVSLILSQGRKTVFAALGLVVCVSPFSKESDWTFLEILAPYCALQQKYIPLS